MTTQIQTVHGVSHPVVTQVVKPEDSEDQSQTSTQLYRDESAARLDRHNQRAKKSEQPS